MVDETEGALDETEGALEPPQPSKVNPYRIVGISRASGRTMAAIISGFGGQPALGSVAFKVGDGLDAGDGWHGDLMQGGN